MSEPKTINDLILEIEKKDRRFRYAQFFFMFAVLASLCIIIAAQYRTLDRIQGNTDRVYNYLRCASLTPVQERTKDFAEKCFENDLPPQTR